MAVVEGRGRSASDEFWKEIAVIPPSENPQSAPMTRWPFVASALKQFLGHLATESLSYQNQLQELARRVFELNDTQLDQSMVVHLTPLLKILRTPEYQAACQKIKKEPAYQTLQILFIPIAFTYDDVLAEDAKIMERIHSNCAPLFSQIESNWGTINALRALFVNPDGNASAIQKLTVTLPEGDRQQRFLSVKVHALFSIVKEDMDFRNKVKLFTKVLLGTAAVVGIVALGYFMITASPVVGTRSASSSVLLATSLCRPRPSASESEVVIEEEEPPKSPAALPPVFGANDKPLSLDNIIIDGNFVTFEHNPITTGWKRWIPFWIPFIKKPPSQTVGTVTLVMGKEKLLYTYNLEISKDNPTPIKVEDLFALNSILHDRLDAGIDPKIILTLLFRLLHTHIDRGPEKDAVHGFVDPLYMTLCFETVVRQAIHLICRKKPTFDWNEEMHRDLNKLLPESMNNIIN